MVGQRAGALCAVAEIHKHQDFFVFRKPKGSRKLLRIKEVDPAAIHALRGRGEDHMGGDDGCVLGAGIPFFAGVCKHIVFIKGDNQHRTGVVAARGLLIQLFKKLLGLYHINVLFLKVFRCGRQAASL